MATGERRTLRKVLLGCALVLAALVAASRSPYAGEAVCTAARRELPSLLHLDMGINRRSTRCDCSSVDRFDAGRGDDERGARDVGGLESPLLEPQRSLRCQGTDVVAGGGRYDGHRGSGLKQTAHLSLGNAPAPDHDDGTPAQIERERVARRIVAVAHRRRRFAGDYRAAFLTCGW